MSTVTSAFSALAGCMAEAFIPSQLRIQLFYPEPPEFSNPVRMKFSPTPDLRASQEFLPYLEYPPRFGTCVLPGYPVVSGDFELRILQKQVPLFDKDRMSGVDVAVLQVERDSRPVHFEIWALAIAQTERRAHANWFPLTGDFLPGRRPPDENILNLEITHWIPDRRWKAEVLRRLQLTGDCLVKSPEC